MKKLLLLGVIFGFNSSAEMSIPILEVEADCDWKHKTVISYNECVNTEQIAYKKIKDNWEKYPQKAINICIEEMEIPHYGINSRPDKIQNPLDKKTYNHLEKCLTKEYQTYIEPEIPNFDRTIQVIEGLCRETSEKAVDREKVYAECINIEEESYQRLAKNWYNYSDGIKDRCSKYQYNHDIGTFTILEDCIKLELEPAKNRLEFQF